MCIGSNSVNQAQDLISVTKFEDFPNSLLPTPNPWQGAIKLCRISNIGTGTLVVIFD